jgi:hypothetical protein
MWLPVIVKFRAVHHISKPIRAIKTSQITMREGKSIQASDRLCIESHRLRLGVGYDFWTPDAVILWSSQPGLANVILEAVDDRAAGTGGAVLFADG